MWGTKNTSLSGFAEMCWLLAVGHLDTANRRRAKCALCSPLDDRMGNCMLINLLRYLIFTGMIVRRGGAVLVIRTVSPTLSTSSRSVAGG